MTAQALCEFLPRIQSHSSPAFCRDRNVHRIPPQLSFGQHLTVRIPAAATAATLAPHSPLSTESSAAWSDELREWSGYLPNSQGAAVLSLAGKENGRPKAANQDNFLTHAVHPSSPASIIGVFDGHGRAGALASARVKETMGAVVEQYTRQALALAECAPPTPTSADAPCHLSFPWDVAEPAEPPSPRYAGTTNLGGATALSAAAGGGAAAALELTPTSAQSCLEATFSRAAEAVSGAADFVKSGTTACVCMVLHDSVVAAWAGDSRAVVGVAQGAGAGYRAVELTRDHKPNNLAEMARIVAAGGRVARVHLDKNGNPVGPFRVFLPAGNSPGLSVARSLGDTMLASVGVVPTPEFAVFPLPPPAGTGATSGPAHILIVASDGLWQFVPSQTAVDIAAAEETPEAAAHALLDAARRSWEARYGSICRDDITIAVAFL